MCLFAELIINNSDEFIGELQDGIFNRSAIHVEGLASKAGNIRRVDDCIFVYRFVDDINTFHAIQAVVGDTVVFGTEAHEVIIVVIENEYHWIHFVAFFILAIDAFQAFVQIKVEKAGRRFCCSACSQASIL